MKTARDYIITLVIAALVLIIWLYSTPNVDAAGMTCGDRTALLKALSEKYKESPRALGLSSSGKAVFEVYVSKTGTWTIVMTTTTGVTCIMAAGHSWEEAPTVDGEPT
ncbi:MAG: hypothetical protein GY789_12075 [Hyphomicrobiales bacterium]|nr:hypothetical protein [Hyphomicrobiales bacterium]